MYIYLLHKGGFWERLDFFTSFNNWSFVALDGDSHSFNIFWALQLVFIVSNPSVPYFDTVDIGPWSGLLAHLTSMVTGSFSSRVLVVYKLYLVGIITKVMGKSIGRIVGLNLDHFLINLMGWNGVSPIFVGLDGCFLVHSL